MSNHSGLWGPRREAKQPPNLPRGLCLRSGRFSVSDSSRGQTEQARATHRETCPDPSVRWPAPNSERICSWIRLSISASRCLSSNNRLWKSAPVIPKTSAGTALPVCLSVSSMPLRAASAETIDRQTVSNSSRSPHTSGLAWAMVTARARYMSASGTTGGGACPGNVRNGRIASNCSRWRAR